MVQNFLDWLSLPGKPPNIRGAIVDLNGIWRGKRIASQDVKKTLSEGMRMPLSVACLDIWGSDLEDSPFLFDSGDADGKASPTGRDIIKDYWGKERQALIPLWMFDDNQIPSKIDPRQILSRVCDKYKEAGLRPVVSVELEFYLLDEKKRRWLPNSLEIPPSTNILSLTDIDELSDFFTEVHSVSENLGIILGSTSAENAPNQFEINLPHVEDPLRAADDAVFFKLFIKDLARKYKMRTSFMAKPFVSLSGSGMHIHFSLLNSAGENIFNDKLIFGKKKLKNAVGGVLRSMLESTLIMAPHQNSYRRLMPGLHAPTGVCWGYENRTAAIRIPEGNTAASRIEHRVAGADANPYLVLAAVLSSALNGILTNENAPDPIEGNSYLKDMPTLPHDWRDAINLFENSAMNKYLFSETFVSVFSKLKRQELKKFTERMEEFEVSTYLNSV